MRARSPAKALVGRAVLLAAAALLATGCTGGVVAQQVPVTGPHPATLTGELYKPAGEGPFPAVVVLHGCSGIQPNATAWAQWLQSEGYAALLLDSFTGRGLRRLCGDSSALRGAARSDDVFAAAASLKKLSVIDGDRIGAMGFSHGGWTVLWAARFGDLHPEMALKAFVAFYPFCGDVASLPGAAPVLMLLGAADDWTPAEPCQQLAAEARQRGRAVSDITYPGARHGFDGSHIRKLTYVPDARRGQGATVEYSSQAHADAEKQVRQFLARYLKEGS